MRRRLALCFAIISTLFVLAPVSAIAASVILITTEEARLPPPKIAVALSARGVTR